MNLKAKPIYELDLERLSCDSVMFTCTTVKAGATMLAICIYICTYVYIFSILSLD